MWRCRVCTAAQLRGPSRCPASLRTQSSRAWTARSRASASSCGVGVDVAEHLQQLLVVAVRFVTILPLGKTWLHSKSWFALTMAGIVDPEARRGKSSFSGGDFTPDAWLGQSNTLLIRSIFRMSVPVLGKNYFSSNIQGVPTWYEIRVTRDACVARSGRLDLVVAMRSQARSPCAPLGCACGHQTSSINSLRWSFTVPTGT